MNAGGEFLEDDSAPAPTAGIEIAGVVIWLLSLTGEASSVERQLVANRNHSAAKGYEVVGESVDNSISAYGGKDRPGWNQVLRAVEAGSCDVVVAWHLDRMTRSMTDLEHLIVLAEKHRIGIATVTGDIDLTTDVGRMVARILAAS